jgi:hypothetical protein
MEQECTKCSNKGKSKFNYKVNYSIPIAGFIMGMGIYYLTYEPYLTISFGNLYPYTLFLPVTLFLISAFLAIRYHSRNKNCPKCGYGNMVNIDRIEEAESTENLNLKIENR